MTPQERERYNEYKKAAEDWRQKYAAQCRTNDKLLRKLDSVRNTIKDLQDKVLD
jgi:uncharacterized membrane protein (DUF106 family)